MVSQRRRLSVRGAIQGVGFRPWVYRTAKALHLSGWVKNDAQGVTIELEGEAPQLDAFVSSLWADLPEPASIEALSQVGIEPCGEVDFTIAPSTDAGPREATMLADLAPCPACLAEFFEPSDRRYRYPFINCTHCGPRFTIIRGLPYDRPATTMAGFSMCSDCSREYHDPRDRRFHAQPNACPRCGPRLTFFTPDSPERLFSESALTAAKRLLEQGQIVGVLGVGGFQLLVDARNTAAVRRLRERKHRATKPLAVMARDTRMAADLVELDAEAVRLLERIERPILLLKARSDNGLSELLAPANPRLGVMLPSSPLHHLLLVDLGIPLVATSGNLSEEPICINEPEALARLSSIADGLLSHDRPIARHADDSVLSRVGGHTQMLRRARGFAPRPLLLPTEHPPVLALGAHQKNTVALLFGNRCVVSQHIGDLSTLETVRAQERVVEDLLSFYNVEPRQVAVDLHPDYQSTRFGERLVAPGGRLAGAKLCFVQHHKAHLVAVLAEHHALNRRVLGVIWDGTGLGTDGSIWGGEFFLGTADNLMRYACLEPYLLPGGDATVRFPCRTAFSLLAQFAPLEEALGLPLGPSERAILRRQLERRLNTVTCSSMGRLFDAIASLLGQKHESDFEGDAAIALEALSDPVDRCPYPMPLRPGLPRAPGATAPPGPLLLDPRPLFAGIHRDLAQGVPLAAIAGSFHLTLVEAITEVARRADADTVVLSGGCFQNALLLALTQERLLSLGHEVLLPSQFPPNDGGIAVGQAISASLAVPRAP